jgi:hypothetical protein
MEKSKVCKTKGKCMHCRYCGKPILWIKGCRDSLKDLISGDLTMELCNRCIERIARYWLGLHGI